MKKQSEEETKSLKARIKMAVAGLVLAGALAGGVAAVGDIDPVSDEDTTETAFTWWGLSWR